MDIQKEREVFEVFFYENCLVQWEKDISETLFQKLESGDYEYVRLQSSWLSWQAAKAQAVPEGYVVMPIKPTETMVMAVVNEYEGEAFLPYSLYDAYVKQAMIEAQEQDQ